MIADGVLCGAVLWFLLNYARSLTIRNAGSLAWSVLEFGGFCLLLQRPVRKYFQDARPRALQAMGELPEVRAESGVSQGANLPRVAVYFAVAAFATCVITAFSVALVSSKIGEGGVIFILFLYYGFMTGSVPALVFAMILTFVVRKLGPERLKWWLPIGGSLAPALTVGLAGVGAVAGYFNVIPYFYVIFCAPMALLEVWWLTVPIGVLSAWVCYAMYPWAFADAQRNARQAHGL